MAPFIPRPPKPPKIPIATSFSSIPLLSGVKNAIAPRCGAQGIRTRNRDATATNGARPAPRMADDSQTGITRIALTSKHVVRHSQSERSLSENCNRRRLLFSNLGFVHPSLGSLRLTSTTTAQLRRTPNPTRIGARTLCSTSSASSKQKPNCGALELSQSPEDESGIDDEALLVDSEWTRLFQGMIPLRPDLKLTGGLPPLPPVVNDDLRKQIFTHRSLAARSRHDFEDEPGDPAPDNEVLEFQGDAVLGLIIADLVRETYPMLRVGPATKIRSLVVGNATLADISVKYEIPQKMHLQRAQSLTLQASPHIQADAFEAYVGGLYIEQGLDVVRRWTKALFMPYIKEAYRICREQHITMPSPPPSPSLGEVLDSSELSSPSLSEDSSTGSSNASQQQNNGNGNNGSGGGVGHLSFLNQYLAQKKIQYEWKYDSIHEEGNGGAQRLTPVWRAKLVLDGQRLAAGKGVTKKVAQNEAARDALKALGVVVPCE